MGAHVAKKSTFKRRKTEKDERLLWSMEVKQLVTSKATPSLYVIKRVWTGVIGFIPQNYTPNQIICKTACVIR